MNESSSRTSRHSEVHSVDVVIPPRLDAVNAFAILAMRIKMMTINGTQHIQVLDTFTILHSRN